MDFKADDIGMAKPIPADTPRPRDAVLIPMISPSLFKSGPPLFPGLIAASV